MVPPALIVANSCSGLCPRNCAVNRPEAMPESAPFVAVPVNDIVTVVLLGLVPERVINNGDPATVHDAPTGAPGGHAGPPPGARKVISIKNPLRGPNKKSTKCVTFATPGGTDRSRLSPAFAKPAEYPEKYPVAPVIENRPSAAPLLPKSNEVPDTVTEPVISNVPMIGAACVVPADAMKAMASASGR